ncbi:hypothetical protein Trydic_g8896 [Trypoxylus dichotomus]
MEIQNHLDNINREDGYHLPAMWKRPAASVLYKPDTQRYTSDTVPKPKKDHHLPEGYRPISLLYPASKVLETLLLARINDHLDDDQSRFISGYSSTSQLFRVTDHVTTAFNRKQITVMVSLDLEKAFDKFCHEGLLLKLKDCVFPARRSLEHTFKTGVSMQS